MKIATLTIRARIGGANGPVLTLQGREAWALLALVSAGESGCTPIDTPGPRWSAYVHDLRRLGFSIETIREKHAGKFPGQHARYVLRSCVEIVDRSEAA